MVHINAIYSQIQGSHHLSSLQVTVARLWSQLCPVLQGPSQDYALPEKSKLCSVSQGSSHNYAQFGAAMVTAMLSLARVC